MAKANTLSARDLVEISSGSQFALVSVDVYMEDGEQWVYAVDVNGEELEWRGEEEVAVAESNVKPIDYISDCYWCERPANVCACP